MGANLHSIEMALNFTEALLRDKTRSNLKHQLGILNKEIGMTGFTWWYGTHDDFEEVDTRPKAWMDYYNDNQCLFVDPIVKEAILTASPFLWNDVMARPDLGVEEYGFMESAAAFGMVDGVHFPVGTILGKWGCLSFFTDDHSVAARAWKAYRLPLTHIAFVCNQFSVDIGMASNVQRPNLSRGEIGALMALASGRTRAESAAALGIKPSTVDHYAKAIIRKTESPNLLSAGMKVRLTLPAINNK